MVSTNTFIKFSFFDDIEERSKKKLWEKVKFDQEEQISEIIEEAEFLYQKKNRMQYYFLCEDSIFCSKENYKNIPTVVNKKMDLNFVRLEVLSESENSEYPFGFLFIVKNKEYSILTKNETVFLKWKNILRYSCVMHSFHIEFEVKKIIGKGHFAKVYYAIKKENGKEFAIKAFNKEALLSEKNGRAGFLNEITIMKQLKNNNVLKLYEVYETKNSLYLVLELIKGGELLRAVSKKKQFKEIDLKLLMKNLLTSLKHIHSKDILHRDIKPDNLLLRDENIIHDIVIADFGLSCQLNNEKILYKRCGTPGYVAPEILKWHEGDAFYSTKCDIFSIGCIFYLMLTGRKLFKGSDYQEVLTLNRQCKIDFNAIECYKISPIAMDLLQSLLDPSPIKRFSAAYALKHKYFIDIPENLESNESTAIVDFSEFKEDNIAFSPFSPYSNNKAKPSFDSFVMKKAILNGRVDTIEKLSENNISSICSLKEYKRSSLQTGKSKFGLKYSTSFQLTNSNSPMKKTSLMKTFSNAKNSEENQEEN